MNGSFLKKIVLVNTRNTSLYTFHICIFIAPHFSCVRRKKENFKTFLPKMILWSHLPNNESSTPKSLTKLKLVVKIRSIQEEDVLILRVDWLTNWLYAAVEGFNFVSFWRIFIKCLPFGRSSTEFIY